MKKLAKGNILKILPQNATEEVSNIIHKNQNIRIEQIISSGQTSPAEGWYDQEENEWVILLQGNAHIEFEGSGIVLLRQGDHILIDAHRKHKVIFTSKNPCSIWLAIFFK